MDASSLSGDDDDWEIVSTSFRSRSPSPKPKTSESEAESVAAAASETIGITVEVPTPAAPPTPLILLSFNMPGWKDEYLSSILEAERNSPVNQELVEACSLLNDRIAALEAEKAHWQLSSPSPSNTQPTTTKEPTTAADPAQSRLRADLAEALRQKSSLETRLRKTTSERDALQATSRTQARVVRDLTAERDTLRLRVGDQAEELRGKKQMLEQVQDEVLALELQLNVAEQQKAKIAAENKQLIERWMRRARQEADDMNAANEKRSDGT
ncbi:hypothetical protein J7T55_009196 [Diaporthe amygdali]|uniref:uncharacterized protein n=1 Tax=Phomopsis amygdali TaxID=1214568 RepID=UPI0022FE363A|nr:uncharacterized protein J7T55_009196 [Diaporthe amygdali]KAJ0118413.1 hypothetical protein J7T55_009196 [Diaporthe amygdali]